MQEASATRRDTAARPGRGVPPGCPWAGRLLWRRSSPCSRHGIVAPSRSRPGPGSNAPRALPGSDPTMRGAARRAMRCHRERAATKQMAPNPLRPNGLPRHGPACCVVAPRRCAKASTASRRLASWVATRQGSLARRQRPGMRGKERRGGRCKRHQRRDATPPRAQAAASLRVAPGPGVSFGGAPPRAPGTDIVAPSRIHPGPGSNAPRAPDGPQPQAVALATRPTGVFQQPASVSVSGQVPGSPRAGLLCPMH